MNKKSENNISTSRILKSKYIQKQKQNTVPLIRKSYNKIKLVDLCPQQKLKVGQLIKVLEYKNHQILQITEEHNILKRKFQDIQAKLQSVSCLLQVKQIRCSEMQNLIEHNKKQIRQKSEFIERYQQKLFEYHRIIEAFQKNNDKKQKGIQTKSGKFTETSTQTKAKKIISNNYQIQVNLSEAKGNLFYKPHSKSFEKIMKASTSLLESSPHQFNKIITTERFTKIKNQESQLEQDSPSVSNFQEQLQHIQQLDSKWKQLQQKHIDKNHKQFLENSKHIMPKNSQKQFKLTKNFNHHGINKKYFIEQSNSERQLGNYRKNAQKIQNYDQFYLNRMLKQKNFSAHKAFSLQRQSLKQSMNNMSPQVNYLKSPYFNSEQEVVAANKNQRNKVIEGYSEGRINFFESDILELDQRANLS